jgi:signal transduction histidine kinase/AmiR/NasT family two-component response regulator
MRIVPSIAAVPLLIILLSWLALHASQPDAELLDRALSEIEEFTTAEAALHRDVLAARAGLLRNYDPLADEVRTLYASLGRIRSDVANDRASLAAVDRLEASVREQEQAVESFKTDNALLQNSLAYFAMFSGRLDSIAGNDPPAPLVNSLSVAMLRFTLDSSPDNASDVQNRINLLQEQAGSFGDDDLIRVLVAHGRMLLRVLPTADGALKALRKSHEMRDRDALRSIIMDRQIQARYEVSRFRLYLYIASLLLVGILVYLGLVIHARARAIQRRAALEHVIAQVSMRFMNSHPSEVDGLIDQALAEMAECVGADRAYFLVLGSDPRTYTWQRAETSFPPNWPDRAPALAAKFGHVLEDVVQVVNVNRLPSGPRKEACRAFGLTGWVYASRITRDRGTVALGFDAVHQSCRITAPGELGLTRMALDTIVNAIERQAAGAAKLRLEARLQQTQRMETIGALASGIAHNFNNIIGAILGYVEVAELHVKGGSKTAGYLSGIRRAGERARDLVEQILAFGRRRDARRRPVRLRTLLDETGTMLRASLPAKVDLVIHPSPDEAIVSADPAHLQQVILNLCANAAQAIDGNGTVEVDTHVHQIHSPRALSHGVLNQGRYVCIGVNDSGRGMEKAVLERIFEPFFTTRSAGNGLGLATVREIVREHGGAIDVKSEPGAGTRFEAWFACVVGAPDAINAALAPLSFGHGETVLVLDTRRDQLLHNEELLAALGYEPVGFVRLDDALESCREAPNRFDAIVIGQTASASSLLEAAAKLRAVIPSCPIFVAAPSEDVSAEALIAAGITEIVHWPLHPTDIGTALTRSIEAWRRRFATSVTLKAEADIDR